MIHLGLLGWPVSHSLSPKIQNAALAAAGLDGVYQLFPVDPGQLENIGDLMNKIREGELVGLNVTIPYKQIVIPYMDELTPSARRIGAVNAIYMRDHRLIGHNTDSPGFESDLRNKAGNIMDKPGSVLVLGAGGSARAVVSALLGMSWKVIIAARNLDQAHGLSHSMVQDIETDKVECIAFDLEAISPYISQLNLVVNTTPVGMYPKIENTPWLENLSFPANAFVYDLIYNPSETKLVAQARAAGLQAANGLGMLVEQAALGFEIWTGKPASREVMYSAVGTVSQ